MRRNHPERIFVLIVASFVLGGALLSLAGTAAQSRGSIKFGFAFMVIGGIFSCLPLVAALIHTGWRNLSRFIRNRKF